MNASDMQVAVKAAIQTRIEGCEAAGNEAGKRKWMAELKMLTMPSYVDALVELGFKPEQLQTLAIYATQKVRRLVGAYIGADKPDPYTQTLLSAAQANAGALGSKFAMAMLSDKVRVEDTLKSQLSGMVRRSATEGTASTQTYSTRQALVALGAGKVESKGNFSVDLDSMLLKTVLA